MYLPSRWLGRRRRPGVWGYHPDSGDLARISHQAFGESACSGMSPHTPLGEPGYPSVSVIVPTHQGGQAFRHCLTALAALDPAPSERIVVTDGDPAAATEAHAESGVRVLQLEQRNGPAAARNRGAACATGDILLFLDADIVAPSGLIGQLQRAFASAPELDAVIGSYDDRPCAPGLLSQYRNLLHHHTHQVAARQTRGFWTGCGAVRRRAFLDIGGFDEAYFIPAMEDMEFGYRLSRAGHRIELHREIQVTHLKAWTVRSMLSTDIWQRAIPWTQLLLREGDIPGELNLQWGQRVSAILAWLLLVSLGAIPFWTPAGVMALLALMGLVVLNASFYALLRRRHGVAFMLAAFPWHCLYFLYSSLAFAYVQVSSFRRPGGRPSAR
jgi:GT2 family glycosyltransferase